MRRSHDQGDRKINQGNEGLWVRRCQTGNMLVCSVRWIFGDSDAVLHLNLTSVAVNVSPKLWLILELVRAENPLPSAIHDFSSFFFFLIPRTDHTVFFSAFHDDHCVSLGSCRAIGSLTHWRPPRPITGYLFFHSLSGVWWVIEKLSHKGQGGGSATHGILSYLRGWRRGCSVHVCRGWRQHLQRGFYTLWHSMRVL